MAASSTTYCANWPRKLVRLTRIWVLSAGCVLALAACSGEAHEDTLDDAGPAPSLIPQLASLETDQSGPSVFVMGIDARSFARRIAQEDVRLIDVRTPAEFAQGAIPGAENIPLDAFQPEDFLAGNGQQLLLYCRSGRRSGEALARLEVAGISGAVHLTGGILAWQETGYSLQKP